MLNDKDEIDFEAKEFIPDDDTKILRYMDFPEFLYMLEYQKLYFNKAKLFEDKYEELLPGIIAKVYEEDNINMTRKCKWVNEAENRIYINSWTEFNKESYAMWHIYSKKYGIAIETECCKLSEIIKPYNGIVRRVKYIDANKCENMIRSGLNKFGRSDFHVENMFVLKSDSYEYENEIRAIFDDKSEEAYKEIKVDIKYFLSSIIISPFASRWFVKMVRDIVYCKYDFKDIRVYISGVEIRE